MSEDFHKEDDFNLPDMESVEMEVALEHIASMYIGLRKAGLPIADAAAIMAAVMTARADR